MYPSAYCQDCYALCLTCLTSCSYFWAQAWAILSAHKRAFEEEEYLTSDLERRNKDRLKLFALFDIAKQESLLYWAYKDDYDMRVAEVSNIMAQINIARCVVATVAPVRPAALPYRRGVAAVAMFGVRRLQFDEHSVV
jgi:hypothetical protein